MYYIFGENAAICVNLMAVVFVAVGCGGVDRLASKNRTLTLGAGERVFVVVVLRAVSCGSVFDQLNAVEDNRRA